MASMQKIKFAPGIYDNISNEDYHASEGISRSMLGALKNSPAHFYGNYISLDIVKEKTDDMIFGDLVHALILEPDRATTDFIIKEKVDGRTTKGKEYNEWFALASAGKCGITPENFAKAREMVCSFFEHKHANIFLRNAKIEQTMYWIDEETGLLCKARPDIFNEEIGIICDIKTTADALPSNFPYSVKKYNYHIQAAMQLEAARANGKEIRTFTVIALSKTPPYMPYVYTLEDSVVGYGHMEYMNGLRLYKACLEQGWHKDRERVMKIEFSPHQTRESEFEKSMEAYNVQY